MADALTTITDFILKPAAPFAAGFVLFGVVWGFFKGVEGVLNEETKLEIWVWLADRKPLRATFQSWPVTFITIFDRVFGKRYLSWRCFVLSLTSSIASFVTACIVAYLVVYKNNTEFEFGGDFSSLVALCISSFLPDYLSLVKSRWLLGRMRSTRRIIRAVLSDWTGSILLSVMTLLVFHLRNYLWGVHQYDSDLGPWWEQLYIDLGVYVSLSGFAFPLVPASFTSIWLWLYAGSGFLLRAARRFDIGFQWFNRRFDIEKHPLSSIGLVAGVLVALVYWTAVVVSRIVG